MEISGGKSGEEREIASVRVSYENPYTKQNEVTSGQVTVRFSGDELKVKESVNLAVQREYYLNLNAMSQEMGISFSDKGKKEAAVCELRKSAAALKEIGQLLDDRALLAEAKEVEVQAAQIEKDGMTKKQRKVLRTKSFQMKNQQMSK